MEIYAYWFLLALVLAGLEMISGTFYLLVVAIAMAVGGVAALLGAAVVWQFVLGAVTGITGTIYLRRWKSAQPASSSDDNLDLGQPVKILRWNDSGSARVSYRGAEWDATLESADTPRDGALYIAAVRGASLVLTHRKQQ
jgi:membrane protein implicated in regulation of membrane protease activity